MFRKFLIPLLTAVFLAAPVFAPATMTGLSGSALAQQKTPTAKAASVNGSRSNTFKTINPGDQNAVNACTSGGGTVGKDPKGQDACITPAPAPNQGGTAGIAVSDPGAPGSGTTPAHIPGRP